MTKSFMFTKKLWILINWSDSLFNTRNSKTFISPLNINYLVKSITVNWRITAKSPIKESKIYDDACEEHVNPHRFNLFS
jgi:hypothetical protein